MVALAKEGLLDLALHAVAGGQAVDIERAPVIDAALANQDVVDVGWHLRACMTHKVGILQSKVGFGSCIQLGAALCQLVVGDVRRRLFADCRV